MNYWKWMEQNNKTALEASKHFGVSISEVWEQINERNKNRES